jgi:N4-gp56 family major capsid protein
MALDTTQRQYGTDKNGANATMGDQLTKYYYYKKALIEARKIQVFSQLADVRAMPKNSGKEIKQYHYLPLLDDANVNSQGLDAAGAVIANGNLYGSSKDIGTINGKLPLLSETGGRVNRVGFTRKEITGTFEKLGFFDEYTKESLDFDSDEDLEMHINREMVNGALEITEDMLQIDLLSAAGVVRYAGNATSKATIGADDVVEYKDLLALSIDLDNNRTPKHTTAITGTRLVDTKVIPGARIAYIGNELLPTLEKMKDFHDERAFVHVEKYAAGGTTLNGEVGQVGPFRFVVAPEMLRWAGAGADASAEAGLHYETGNKFDVMPILVIGDGSFTTIGFQTDGKTVKFDIKHKKPGLDTADRNDPYGETGFMSIKWFYGFMALRPERMGLILTAAKL